VSPNDETAKASLDSDQDDEAYAKDEERDLEMVDTSRSERADPGEGGRERSPDRE
jgi:hypothetical protein